MVLLHVSQSLVVLGAVDANVGPSIARNVEYRLIKCVTIRTYVVRVRFEVYLSYRCYCCCCCLFCCTKSRVIIVILPQDVLIGTQFITRRG